MQLFLGFIIRGDFFFFCGIDLAMIPSEILYSTQKVKPLGGEILTLYTIITHSTTKQCRTNDLTRVKTYMVAWSCILCRDQIIQLFKSEILGK